MHQKLEVGKHVARVGDPFFFVNYKFYVGDPHFVFDLAFFRSLLLDPTINIWLNI